MGLIYEDDSYHSAYDVKKFDADRFDRFIDYLAHDIDRYTGNARALEAGYGKYYHNSTYIGKAANASKEFIDRKQFDKFHTESKDIQRELFNRCLNVQNMFKEQVDPSPKARIDSETLELIKHDQKAFSDELEYEGYDIECFAREIENNYGKYGEVTQPNYRRTMETYDEFCGNGGFLNKCLRKFEDFNEDARQYMNRSMIKEHSRDLQKDIKATASALEGMTVFRTEVQRQLVWINALSGKNVVVDPKKLIADIKDIIRLSGLKYDKNAIVDANIVKKATDLALLNCKNKNEKAALLTCSNAMQGLLVDPMSVESFLEAFWIELVGIVTTVTEIIASANPVVLTVTLVLLLISAILLFAASHADDIKKFVSPRDKEENSHVIDIPPTEDEKSIIEGPTAIPQESPLIIDIPPKEVEESELKPSEEIPDCGIEDPKIYQGKKENSKNGEGTRPPNLTPEGAKRRGAFREAKRRNGIPNSQQPQQGRNYNKRGELQPGRSYDFGDDKVIRDDSAGHEYPDDPIQNRGPHFNDPAGNHYDY